MATVRDPKELAAWRRCSELKDRVFEIIARPGIARHFNFCDQIERSARSAPSNVAEGLGRYQPHDNARFVRIALGSLHETKVLLEEARARDYIKQSEFDELSTLVRRAIGTNVRWHNYLKKCPRRPPNQDP